MDQYILRSYLVSYCDGDDVPFDELVSVVTFDWLSCHVGRHVAIRFVTEHEIYYVVATVIRIQKGTNPFDCRRVLLRTSSNSFYLFNESYFFLLGLNDCFHLVYEI